MYYPGERQVKESFKWMSPKWKALTFGPKTCKVKGVAMLSDVVSKNKRQYLDEELRMAARTLSGRAINVNHDDHNIIGNVIHAEYEDGKIEFLGQIKNKTYAEMLKNKDPLIRGVSVQADYLHLKCTKCGATFYTEKAWSDHMSDAHGISEGTKQVHGMIFNGLSLVVAPEIPGVANTKIEVAETAQNDMLRICETYLNERGFSAKVESQIGVTREGKILKPTKDKLTLGEPLDSHGCEPWEKWDGEKCVKKEATEETEPEISKCPEGQAYDPELKKCVPIKQAVETALRRASQYKRVSEKLLDIADENADRRNEIIKTLEERLLRLDNAKGIKETLGATGSTFIEAVKTRLDSQDKKISEAVTPETAAELRQRIETLEENARANLRGNFKGQNKKLKTTETAPSYNDQWTPPKKKGKK